MGIDKQEKPQTWMICMNNIPNLISGDSAVMKGFNPYLPDLFTAWCHSLHSPLSFCSLFLTKIYLKCWEPNKFSTV